VGLNDGGVPDALFGESSPEAIVECGALVQCGRECADTESDPNNCGGCGRSCVIPHAAAACETGQCAIARCEVGYHDRDLEPTTGCEIMDNCEAGAECTTGCGSLGIVACTDGASSCTVPIETCNAGDDDCDGECDEGVTPGCRVFVHRANGVGHLYTTDIAMARTAPYHVEVENYFRIYAMPAAGLRPVFRCLKANGKRLLTTDTACEMLGAGEAQLGFWSPTALCGAEPLYRLHEPVSDNHFYTLSTAERDNAINNLGYVSQGVAGYVWR